MSRKRRKAGWSATRRANAARRELDGLRAEAGRCGLLLLVREVKGAVGTFQHWIFYDRDRVVFHYWPRKGSWWRPDDNEKGTCREHVEAVELASMAAKRVPV